MTRVAAVDMGTNSTRLLVSDGTRSLERLMRITRLGEGVDQTRRLAPEAVGRTVDVLREYRGVIDDLGATSVRATATSAARDASNCDEFFAAVEDVLGVRPELLSGDEEGRLSFRGAVRELDRADGPFLVVDIGGGSTVFIVGTDDAEGVVTTDMGCVRITEKFLHGDPPEPEELSNAIGVVHDILDDVARELPAVRDARRLVGLAGTVSTMAAVEIGLATYDRDRIHHFVLTHHAAEDVFRTLATERRSDRIHNPGLEEARADVIVGGALILVTIMRTWGIGECLVSEADILDGLVQSQLP
jgi:exopolyphosphatase/guanosine-5'-triphosphate,3'-diphosphate pyrophosphatase